MSLANYTDKELRAELEKREKELNAAAIPALKAIWNDLLLTTATYSLQDKRIYSHKVDRTVTIDEAIAEFMQKLIERCNK